MNVEMVFVFFWRWVGGWLASRRRLFGAENAGVSLLVVRFRGYGMDYQGTYKRQLVVEQRLLLLLCLCPALPALLCVSRVAPQGMSDVRRNKSEVKLLGGVSC